MACIAVTEGFATSKQFVPAKKLRQFSLVVGLMVCKPDHVEALVAIDAFEWLNQRSWLDPGEVGAFD